METEIEVLAIGNCVLEKEDQDPGLKLDYKDEFDLD
jgi:carbamoyltransferase